MTNTLTHFIGGQPVSGELSGESSNPSNTVDIVARSDHPDELHQPL